MNKRLTQTTQADRHERHAQRVIVDAQSVDRDEAIGESDRGTRGALLPCPVIGGAEHGLGTGEPFPEIPADAAVKMRVDIGSAVDHGVVTVQAEPSVGVGRSLVLHASPFVSFGARRISRLATFLQPCPHRLPQFAERRYAMRMILALTAALVLVPATHAATVKPWQWTPTQAEAKLDAVQHLFGKVGGAGPATCQGVGKHTGTRYGSFACRAEYKAHAFGSEPEVRRVWLRVRQAGGGSACLSTVSLAAVPAGCLRARAAVSADRQDPSSDVGYAVQKRVNPGVTGRFQGFGNLDCLGADGWYQCTFASMDNSLTGSAVVIYVKSGPLVRFTSWAG